MPGGRDDVRDEDGEDGQARGAGHAPRQGAPRAGGRLERRAQLRRGLPPLGRRPGQRARERLGERVRHARPVPPRGVGREGPGPSGERFVQDEADRVQVARRRDLAPGELLGRHVAGAPHRLAVARQGRLAARGDLGDAEVADHRTVGQQEDVPRLDVAVHDATAVDGLERGEHVARHPHGLPRRQRAAAQALGERLRVEVVHHVVGEAGRFAGAVHGDQVGVADAGEDLRFADEALGGDGGGAVGAEDLDGHAPAQLHVAADEDHAHPAAGQLALDLVVRGQRSPQSLQQRRHRAGPPSSPRPSGPAIRRGSSLVSPSRQYAARRPRAHGRR